MLIIPFKEPAQWREQIEILGVSYIFEFTWNALNEFWTMDIYTRDQEPIIVGVKIVPNYPLLQPYTVFNKPPGEIVCQNIVNSTDTISRFDMSQKFELVYYAPGELNALLDTLEV